MHLSDPKQKPRRTKLTVLGNVYSVNQMMESI
jgi:hypothetical protein